MQKQLRCYHKEKEETGEQHMKAAPLFPSGSSVIYVHMRD
jgi:hypothetical protein